jgi:hypothetical protein
MIPAHTITFFLSAEYRVLRAAFLSTALGAILAFAKSRHGSQDPETAAKKKQLRGAVVVLEIGNPEVGCG